MAIGVVDFGHKIGSDFENRICFLELLLKNFVETSYENYETLFGNLEVLILDQKVLLQVLHLLLCEICVFVEIPDVVL